MSQKVRKTLIMIVMAALIICLMAASLTYTFTYGRYAGGKFDEESPYDDLIEFVGAREYTVRSPEELIQAIEDGYSNIVIAEDAEEPFVITEGVTDVTANLVLNLNGKVVVRNSRNPMLDVQTNVSVVLVYDSKNTGAFYNPVGSSLMASGGSLTVGSGGYESGPRAEEYENGTDAGTLSPQPSDVAIFTRGGITSPDKVDRANQLFYQEIEVSSGLVPKTTGRYYRKTAGSGYTFVPQDTFLVYTVEEDCFIGEGTPSGDVKFESGKLYVDAESETVGGVTTVTASEFTTPLCNVASCDFYYYYPIGDDDNDGYKDYAVIYGYWDVMALARDDKKNETDEKGMATALKDSGLIWPYASVRMVEGEGIVRGGTFSNHFDVAKSYGIYAEGGTLSVSKNTTVDTTFTTGGEGVCIRVQSATGETTTTGEATTTGGSLTISGGEFSSEIGNTIEMSGGKMTVTAGTFTKDASAADTASTDNGSAIDIQGGTLNMAGAETAPVSFTVTGNYVNGVRVGDPTTSTVTETATIENAVFNFNKGEGSNSVAGVRSFGGTLTVRKSTFNISNGATSGKTITRAAGLSTQGGTVTATTCIFNFAQENATVFPTASAGISSLGGTVTAKDSTFTIPGNNNYGIYSSITSGVTGENQYDTKATNCTFKLTGNNNNGIYALGGKTLASDGTYTIGSENVSGQTANFGIQVSSGSVALAGVTLHVYGEKSSCVYAVGGTISLSGNNAVNMHFSSDKTTISSTAISTEGGAIEVTGGSTSVSSDALGITARQNDGNEGSISIASGAAVTVGSEKSPLPVTGIYVNGGAIENEGTITVFSTINGSFSWNENEKYNGVYVKGGSLVSAGTLNVTFTGVQNDAFGDGDNSGLTAQTAYQDYIVKSYAVRVDGGVGTNVSVNEGTITNQIGGGLYVTGVAPATIYDLSDQTFDGLQNTADYTLVELKNVTIQAQGCDPNGFTKEYINGFNSNWNYKFNTHGGHAVEVDGGIVGIKDGTYSAAQGDGIRVQDGMVFLEGGSFTGRDQYNNNEGGLMPGAAASYAFKVYGGSVKVTGGTFGSQSVAGSGAFVMEGTAYITKATVQAGGTTGFSAWTGATVTFAPANDDDIQVTADSTGLAVENGGTYEELSVTINGGTFQSTNTSGGNKNGIWYGNGNAKLTITGGQFTGSDGSGLFFGATPNTIDGDDTIMIVQISGGRFEGNPVRDGWSSNYSSGAIAGVIGSRWDPRPGYSIGVNYILRIGTTISSSGWGNGETVQDGDGSSKWNDAIQETLASCSWIEIS